MSPRRRLNPSSRRLCSSRTCELSHCQSALLPKSLTSGHRQEKHAMSPLVVNQFQQRISLPIYLPIWCLSLSLPTYLSISIQSHDHRNVHPISPTRTAHLTSRIYAHLFLSSPWHHISPTIFHTTQHFLSLIWLASLRSSRVLQDCSIRLGAELLSTFPTKSHPQHSSQISQHLALCIQSSHFSPTKSLSIQWNHHGSVHPSWPSGNGTRSHRDPRHSPCTRCFHPRWCQTP